MADVKIIGKYTVKPAGEPWTGTMKLGDWDQMVTAVYVPTIYFYRPTEEWAGSGTRSFVDTLKDSLAQALFHFYPMAGRVHRGPDGSQELHCEGQGAEVTEAESSSELADFGDFSCFPKFQHLIPLVDAMRMPIEELPLVSAQLTHFHCGGLSLGLVTNHGIADGLAAYHFINEWARLARGEALHTAPVHDRSLLRAGEPPRGAGFGAAKGVEAPAPPPPGPPMMPPMKDTSMLMLPLSKAQIDKLRSAANATAADEPTKDSTSCRPFSRYEVLTAHLWRSMCKAKGSEGEEPKALAITLDARTRVSPPLPTSYFGNAVLMVAATSPARDLVTKPLGYACGRIRETIAKVTHDYIQADIDHIKSLKNIVVWQGIRNPVDLSNVMPELGVISWLTLPVHGINFGWGDHVHVSPGPSVMDGVSNLLPGKARDGSASVIICVQVEHVDKFKSYFYQDLL